MAIESTSTTRTSASTPNDIDEPRRESYKNTGLFSLSHCCFAYVCGLVWSGSRKPVSVADAMTLCDDMKCEVACDAFEKLWAAECEKSADINRNASAEEVSQSERLLAALQSAQTAERQTEDAVKAAEKALLLAEKTLQKCRDQDEVEKQTLVGAVDTAQATLLEAQDASKAATVATNDARVQYRASKAHPSALSPLLSLYWPQLVYGSVFTVLAGFAPFVGPYAIDYISEKMLLEERISSEDGASIVVLVLVGAVLGALGETQSARVFAVVGIKIRAVFCASVFKKTLKLSPAALHRISKGRITNLMSIDASEINETLPEFGNILSGIITLTVGTMMIVQQLGSATWAGFAGMIATTPITIIIMINFDKHNTTRLEVADRRIEMLSETLNGIRMIKCFAWERDQASRAETFRNKELASIRALGVNNIVLGIIFATLPTFAALCSFAVYTGIQGKQLTPGKAFVTLSVYNIIQLPLVFVPMVLTGAITILNSLRRLGEFLSEEELAGCALLEDTGSKTMYQRTTTALSAEPQMLGAKNATLAWDLAKPILSNLSFTIQRGKTTAIVGPVGSGKSSILSAMLGEMVISAGDMSTLEEPVCFAPQQPWIVNDTVQRNILFGHPFDREWYQKVIQACCLESDLQLMPGGDSTEIGERGINLSGGQKARISLARAVYSKHKICLLDDPLAAVDVHVGKALFENLLKSGTGLMSDTTRVLVTNQLQVLSQVDDIIVLEKNDNGQGQIACQGSYTELMSRGGNIAELLREHNENDNSGQVQPTDKTPNAANQSIDSTEDLKNVEALIETENHDMGAPSVAAYKRYMELGAGALMTVVLGLLMVSDEILRVCSDLWLAWWSQASGDSLASESGASTTSDGDTFSGQYKTKPAAFFLLIFGLIFAASSLLNFFKGYAWVEVAVKASCSIHLNLLQRVLHAPVCFFDKTPVGRILNRFSADMNEIDSEVMWLIDASASFCLQLLSKLLMVIILLANVVTYVALAAPVILCSFYCLFVYYAKTNVGLKQHEATLRSPIFAHFGEAIDGVACIRAYGRDQMTRFERASQAKIDRHHSVFFTQKLAECWFSFFSTLMSGVLMSAVTGLVIANQDNIDPGVAALAMSYTILLANLMQFVIWMVTMLQQKFISVRRVLDYTNNIEQEAPAVIDSNRPPTGWPSRGLIEFDRFHMRYRQGLEPVLSNVSITINPGEKVGIVGRTGAGKSSLVSALFRLVERDSGPNAGPIKIDGVDIQEIGLKDLRSSLTIVPQEPVLFSGTVRNNLDPAVPSRSTDAEMVDAMQMCGLGSMLAGSEGLEAKVCEGGSNLSAGERQLLCLARALLRQPKVLVMDEATANVDMQTDGMIQRTLRTSGLANSTILVIAHRLITIVDMDKILLLYKGRVVEFNSPQELLKDPNTKFSKMVDSGNNSSRLREIVANVASGLSQQVWWEESVVGLDNTESSAVETPNITEIENLSQP